MTNSSGKILLSLTRRAILHDLIFRKFVSECIFFTSGTIEVEQSVAALLGFPPNVMAVLIGHLKVFLDLVETKSFTLTAQKNGISQGAVTNELQSMEHHFNERFVERNTRAFRLTQEGKILRDNSRKIVRTYTKFKSQFEAIPHPVSNIFHITTIPYIGLYSLPSCLQRFQKEHAQVSTLVEYAHVDQVYEDVLNGTADLGLVARPLKNKRIQIIPLHKEPLVLICHPQDRFAKQKKIKLRAFRGESCPASSASAGGLAAAGVES
jgi:DNA-binding transcriptional LysR family regulator